MEFPIHGANLVFIHERKYIVIIWFNSILRKKLNFNLENLLGNNPSCYRHFKYQWSMNSAPYFSGSVIGSSAYIAVWNLLAFEILW